MQVLTDNKGKRLDSNSSIASLELDIASLVSLSPGDASDHVITIPLKDKKTKDHIRVRFTVHARYMCVCVCVRARVDEK
jgi:hypothetical protein